MKPNYHEDLYGWAMANATLMREGKMDELDRQNIIEELESMGGNQYDQLVNRLGILMAHLLKWRYQSSHRSRSWELTIKDQCNRIKRLIKHNPSLKNRTEEAMEEAYEDALLLAEKETGLNAETFPPQCPYIFEQCLSEEFFPD